MTAACAVSPARESLSVAGLRRLPLVITVGLLYCAILIASVALLLLPPRLPVTISTSSSGTASMAWVLPGSLLWDRGVRAGDQILALDGHRATRSDGGFRRVGELRVRTARGTVHVDAGATRRGRATWALVVLSPWFLLFGTLIELRSPRPNIAGVAYALFASAAFGLALAPGADADYPLASAAELIAVPVFALAFARFFLAFPTERNLSRYGKAVAVPPLVAAGLGLAALVWVPLYQSVTVLRVAVVSGYLIIGAGLLLVGFFGTQDRNLRRGLVTLSGGAVASVLPLAIFSMAPRLLGWEPLIPAEDAALALALLPASFAYAILRHDVLSVPLLQRWLVHGLLFTGLLVVCGGIAYVLRRLPPAGVRAPDLWLTALLLLLAGAAFRWLYGRLHVTLDRLIFKDSYDFRTSLQQLSSDLSAIGELDNLAESLPNTLCRLMNLRFVGLLVYEGANVRMRGIAGSAALSLTAALVEAARPSEVGVRYVAVEPDAHPALFVPLCFKEHGVGCLCLGPKLNGEPFRAVDQDLLATLSGHLAALIRNAQLAADLRLKVRSLGVLNDRLERAHEEERAGLAADLHDEPLQTALYLDRQLRSMNGRLGAVDDLALLSHRLADQLRVISKGMRPAALDDLGLYAALDILVTDLRSRSAAIISLNIDGHAPPSAMSSPTELTLYRAAQEALNNALRHAGASSISLTLSFSHDLVRLDVRDDGLGFIVPDQLEQLAIDGHLGLGSLQHRLERAGGQLIVESAQGHGTTVRVEVPAREGQA
ncbi:MAG: GAF domain-containing sensor histidine kinase [Chloroflexota bacterium]